MKELSLSEALKEIIREDPRFMLDAYFFLQEALSFTVKSLSRSHKNPKNPEGAHVSGQELLDGIRRYALQEFGAMSKTVLNTWGITRCEDFGDIVFLLISKGILRKTEKDSIEDFAGGYDFNAAFCEPFRPKASRVGKAHSTRSGRTKPPKA